MLITLSGLDGAGKSTLAEALRTNLEMGGTPAVVFHMNKSVGLYAYLRTIRDLFGRLLRGRKTELVFTTATQPDHSSKPSRAKTLFLRLRRKVIWSKMLRRFVDLGDLATFFLYRLYIEKARGRVLIMDRYFYDRVADLADGRSWRYHRWFLRAVPLPDVPVLVEVTPKEAFARKGEYSVESMTRRRASYAEIFSWIPNAIILKNDDLDRAIEELERIVIERIVSAERQALVVER